MGAEWEPMRGFCMSKEGAYDKPINLNSANDLMLFIINNVEQYPELRIVDCWDNCTMHIIEQSLIFPLPRESDKNNKWDSRQQRFITKE